MTLDTQKTLALLQELLMAIRANDADGYKSWLALGIDEPGRDVVAGPPSPELMVELMTRIKRCCDVTHRLSGQLKSCLWRD